MTLAIYADSFDPVTGGPLSDLRQAARLFSHVVVKEKLSRGEDVSAFCPPSVVARLRQRLSPPSSSWSPR